MKFSDERIIRKRHLGDALKEWREKKQLTQSEVASQLGYSTAQFISNWERGQASPPVEVLPKLGKLYTLSSEQIVKQVERYQEALVVHKVSELRRYLRKKPR